MNRFLLTLVLALVASFSFISNKAVAQAYLTATLAEKSMPSSNIYTYAVNQNILSLKLKTTTWHGVKFLKFYASIVGQAKKTALKNVRIEGLSLPSDTFQAALETNFNLESQGDSIVIDFYVDMENICIDSNFQICIDSIQTVSWSPIVYSTYTTPILSNVMKIIRGNFGFMAYQSTYTRWRDSLCNGSTNENVSTFRVINVTGEKLQMDNIYVSCLGTVGSTDLYGIELIDAATQKTFATFTSFPGIYNIDLEINNGTYKEFYFLVSLNSSPGKYFQVKVDSITATGQNKPWKKFVSTNGLVIGNVMTVTDCTMGNDSVHTDPTTLLPTFVPNYADQKVLTIYPNPVKDELTINSSSEKKDCTIFNSLGEIVMTGDKNTYDVSKLPSGIYYVKTNNAVKKFTKIN